MGCAGRGIQNAANSVLSRKRDSVVDGLERNFELQNDAIDGFQQVSGGIYVGRFQFVVRAFHHKNAILPVGLDKNRRHSAGHAMHLLHMRGVDAELLEIFDRGRAKQIAADARHHEDAAPHSRDAVA